jgi:hypothetical protein
MRPVETRKNQAKSYLFHLLNGNSILSQELLESIVNQIPVYLLKMETCLYDNRLDEAAEYASKIKSAFGLLRSNQLVAAYETALNENAFQQPIAMKKQIEDLKKLSFDYLKTLSCEA